MARRFPIDADHPAYDPGACGPDGFPQCRRCLMEIRLHRRDGFCSDVCLHDFLMRVSPAYVRKAVFARDRGICTHCRCDCGFLDRILRRLASWGTEDDPDAGRSLALRAVEILGFGVRKRLISLWQADHCIPIIEGGLNCGLGNYRTLCLNCHAAETRQLHKRMKRKRDDAYTTPDR